MSFSEEIARLPQREVDTDGTVILQFGLVLTLYFTNGYSRMKREAVLKCVNEFLELHGEDLRWWVIEGGRFSPVAKLVSKDMSKYLLAEKYEAHESEVNWAFQWHGGVNKEDASNLQISGYGASRFDCELHGGLSYLTFSLPPGTDERLLKTCRDLAVRWAERLQPMHGYGGVAMLSAADSGVASGSSAERLLYYAHRYPGLEVDEPLNHSLWTKKGIKGGNWLTVLSDSILERLGGTDALRKSLPDDFDFQTYPGGLVVVAGPHPEIGDRNLQLDAKHYRILAAALRPVRIDLHPALPHTTVGFDRAKFEAWLNRFDPPSARIGL